VVGTVGPVGFLLLFLCLIKVLLYLIICKSEFLQIYANFIENLKKSFKYIVVISNVFEDTDSPIFHCSVNILKDSDRRKDLHVVGV
jgi:hypothetical protein